MASKKISELTELLLPDADDYYVMVDSSESVTKKIKYSIGGGLGVSTHAMTTGQTVLTAGTDIKNTPIEVIFLGAAAAETLEMINGATDGNIKVLVATGNNVTVKRNDSYIKTKNPTANPDFAMQTGDVLALVNVDGNPSSSLNGTWLELFRALQV